MKLRPDNYRVNKTGQLQKLTTDTCGYEASPLLFSLGQHVKIGQVFGNDPPVPPSGNELLVVPARL